MHVCNSNRVDLKKIKRCPFSSRRFMRAKGYRLAGVCFLVAIGSHGSLKAQTWSGLGANDNWNTAGNWVGGVAPVNANPAVGTADLVFDGTSRLTPNLEANWNIDTLTYNPTAGAFVIGGSQLFFESALINNSFNTQTINAPIRLGVQSFNVSFTTAAGGHLLIGGTLDLYQCTLTVAGEGNTTFAGIGTDTGGGGDILKNGTGTLTVSATNAYTGTVTVNAGVMNIRSNTALGTTTYNAGFDTTVASGAALEMQGSITVAAGETLSLNGTGINNGGALRNVSGNNNYSETITLAGTTRINSDSGTLTITPSDAGSANSISGGGNTRNLILGGAGDIVIGKIIATSGGTLTKDGTGMVTLSGAGANTFTGATTVNGGTLRLFYSADASKLANGGGDSLTFGPAASTVDLAGTATHIETVASAVLSGAGTISRSSGTSRLNLNTITVNAGGSLNLTADNIADTDTRNDASGILGGWATRDGNWAMNATNSNNGLITAYTAYTNIARLGGAIANGATTNVRITDTGNTSGNITLSGAGVTSINSLLQSATGGAATIDIATAKTLQLVSGGILIPSTTTGSFTINGPGTLTAGTGAAATIYLNNQSANDVAINSVIANNGGGVVSLLRNGGGTGVTTLTATNTYTGLTTVSSGVLNIQNGSALGNASTGTNITANGALELEGGIIVTGEALTISGLGILSGGSLRNISGSNSYNGNITLAGDSRINSDAQLLTINPGAGNAISGTYNLTLGGDGDILIGRPIATATGTVTKDGDGTVTLSATNTFTGLTLISEGTLAYGASNVISTGPVTVNGSSAVLDLGNNQSDTVGVVTVDGGGSINGTGTSTLTSTGTFDMKNGSVSAILAGTGIVLNKTTTGTVTLSGANTYTGLTTIWAGTLNLQNPSALGSATAGTSVTNGAALELQGNVTVAGEALSILGSGIASGGALRNISGNNSYNGNITILNATRINSDAGLLTINPGTGNAISGNFDLSLGGAGDIAINKVIAIGTGTLTKDGAGELILSAANTYTGLTTVSSGTLTYGASNVIASGNVTVNGASAVLDLGNNQSDTVGVVTLDGGGSITGTGTSTLTSTSSFELKAGSVSAILGGIGIGLNKTTTGTVTLSGTNSYDGVTTISAGILTIQNSSALGSITGGTTVGASGALQVQNNIAVAGEMITLSSIGIGASGGIRSTSGNNSFGGVVTLTGDSRINSDADTLTFDTGLGNVIVGDFNLAVGGAGNIIINDPVAIGIGTLAKDGLGTLTLSAANTYTGVTTVSAGTLMLTGSLSGDLNATGGTVAGTGTLSDLTLNSGATLAPGILGSGILNAQDVTFNGGNFNVDIGGLIAGADYDQLNVTGASFNFAGNVALTIDLGGFDPLDDGSQSFTLINNSPSTVFSGTGLFVVAGNAIAEGGSFNISGQEFIISYTAGLNNNDVVIIAVPEPSSVAMILGGFGLLAGIQRIRRRR